MVFLWFSYVSHNQMVISRTISAIPTSSKWTATTPTAAKRNAAPFPTASARSATAQAPVRWPWRATRCEHWGHWGDWEASRNHWKPWEHIGKTWKNIGKVTQQHDFFSLRQALNSMFKCMCGGGIMFTTAGLMFIVPRKGANYIE